VPAFKNRLGSKLAGNVKTFLIRGMRVVAAILSSKQAWWRMASKDWKLSELRGELVRAGDVRESKPVFFVVGNQKSGTTWLMTMLDSHPEILCQGEGRPFGRTWRQEHLKQKRASYPPTSLYNAIVSSEDLRYWVERSVWSKRDDTDEHLAKLTGLAIEYFLTQQLLRTGKRLVGDKTVLSAPGIMEEVSRICPGTKVVHIIRDGRDVAVSQTHHRWNQAEDRGGTAKITPAQLAKREAYRKNPQKLLRTGEGIFPDGQLKKYAAKWSLRVGDAAKNGPRLLGANYQEVRYEDLLEKPEEEIGRLLNFLGVDATEQVVRRCVEAAKFEKLAGGRERGQEAASFFRKGIAGDWENVFTERDKQEFKAAAGDLLIKLGYEEDNDW
jgi:hypothetical protein